MEESIIHPTFGYLTTEISLTSLEPDDINIVPETIKNSDIAQMPKFVVSKAHVLTEIVDAESKGKDYIEIGVAHPSLDNGWRMVSAGNMLSNAQTFINQVSGIVSFQLSNFTLLRLFGKESLENRILCSIWQENTTGYTIIFHKSISEDILSRPKDETQKNELDIIKQANFSSLNSELNINHTILETTDNIQAISNLTDKISASLDHAYFKLNLKYKFRVTLLNVAKTLLNENLLPEMLGTVKTILDENGNITGFEQAFSTEGIGILVTQLGPLGI